MSEVGIQDLKGFLTFGHREWVLFSSFMGGQVKVGKKQHGRFSFCFYNSYRLKKNSGNTDVAEKPNRVRSRAKEAVFIRTRLPTFLFSEEGGGTNSSKITLNHLISNPLFFNA